MRGWHRSSRRRVPEPSGILGEIVARKRIDVAQRLAGIGLESLRARAQPTRRSLAAALARPGARFIMEVKRASPSQGRIGSAAIDPAAIARAYCGAADAISVLTDGPYFGGSFGDLEKVRAAYDGPLLCKDFLIDSRQVAEARIAGADAILVMLSVLGDAEAAAMIEEARRFGMEALVEAHDVEEVSRAVALGAKLIGINNRNLRTLEVDLACTAELAGLIPPDRLIVSESGIEDRADIARLSPFADAFLVGSALMRAPNLALAARALAFGRVKVCGLTSAEDVDTAAAAGASYAGLIFVPDTPRAIDPEQAEALARRSAVPVVGVFRDQALDYIADVAARLTLHAVQLHGSEEGDYVAALRRRLPAGCEIWTATGSDAAPRQGGDRSLFDSIVDGRSGGTGRTFDWSRLRGRADLANGLLAGGLNAANARSAAGVGAFALDVGSGVEAAPGRKDPAKLAAFFEALRLPVREELLPC
jgi:indole-3-glycerol phosphate synthase/phosphoribosylanthranilate isomerase